MDWNRTLSTQRLAKQICEVLEPNRRPFEVDADRILFSPAFRRLQDKTQVHGPAGNDYVRTRLTHSLEVSRVGRSLGNLIGARLFDRHKSSTFTPADIGHVVASAALAHDIGNPPFGHTGEKVISDFFAHEEFGQELIGSLSDRQKAEFMNFEGNAQGFRVLARLQGWRETGGLQLTAATLATFAKYPRPADVAIAKGGKIKYGFFESEVELFSEVAEATGMIANGDPLSWHRHPFVYVLEAADDICYRIVDIEDAVVMHCISFEEAEELLFPVASVNEKEYAALDEQERKLTYLRSQAIHRMVMDAAEAFMGNEQAIFSGEFNGDLIKVSPVIDHLDVIEKISRARVYNGGRRNRTDLTASRVLALLLDVYCRAFLEREENDGKMANRNKYVLKTFPNVDAVSKNRSEWLRSVVDHVAGMTDRFAVEMADMLRPQ